MINVLGLMSGTSCDGLDCCDAQIELDENYNFDWKINKFQTIDYTNEEKAFLLSTRNSTNNKETEVKYEYHLNSPCYCCLSNLN